MWQWLSMPPGITNMPCASISRRPAGSPGASAVIYGGVDAKGIVFNGVTEALRVPGTEVRLFGKPESFVKRRMGVALATADDVDAARAKARTAAAKVVVKGQ